jgi:quinol monooxygenase YgiN
LTLAGALWRDCSMVGSDGREVVLSRLQAQPAKVEAVRALLADMARSTWQEEPEALSYSVFQEREDPTVFWVHEVFASAAALQHHLERHEWRRPSFDAALAGPAEFRFCRPLFPDPRLEEAR